MEPLADGDEQCPACLTRKSASPNLRFKINNKCYHRICESCIDRVYASGGQHTCPYPHCKNTFWKNAWRTQTFEDLNVEKEVNIRRDIYSTLNKEEGDFISKRAYDDFLELREMFVMNLLLGTEAQATRRKLNEYKEANGLVRLKDEAAGPKGKIKRTSATPVAATAAAAAAVVDDDYPDRSGLIEGLKRIVIPEVLPPYDPLQGVPLHKDYFTITDDGINMDTGYEQYRKDEMLAIEGYDFREALEETLTRAFAGLGVFIQAEKSTTLTAPVVGLDDPF
ncbi:hypothetical protein DV735_g4667, partial [Chaetothyriales sp. CBS 134920]